MGHLWAIAQAHMDRYGVRAAALARKMGTAPQTLDSWKNRGIKRLPERWLLEALARETGTPYEVVLRAALRDIAYLPDDGDGERVTSERATFALEEPGPTASRRAGGEPPRSARP